MAIGVNQGERPDPGAWFAERFGREPEGIWFAPGRVNLMGGPDYTEMFVLPFALGAGITAAAAPRTDRRIALASRQFPGEPVLLDIDTLEPGSVTGWAAYPAGVAWALRQAGHLPADGTAGADVAIDADLPAGAGLSSSAALECAAALALTELHQRSVPRRELAALTRGAENGFVGVPTGVMDQTAALLCEAGHALLLDCRARTGTAVPLALAGLTLLIIDTGVRHALGDGRYAARRQACDQAASLLGARTLRDVTEDQLAGLTDPSLRRLSGHVIAENRRVLQAADLLRAGATAAIGALLTASHRSLRDDFKMSWPQADEAVEAAVEAGAAGARMTGGGFGGCVIALVPTARASQVRSAVTARFTSHQWQPPHFLAALPSAGARRLR
jgi:galactokinase